MHNLHFQICFTAANGYQKQIFWGGHVELKKIFILHSNEYQGESTKNYGGISISQDYNILFDIAENKGPKKSLVILGYSGWGSGQLEGEMERDHWILSDLDSNIIFEKESKKKWEEATKIVLFACKKLLFYFIINKNFTTSQYFAS